VRVASDRPPEAPDTLKPGGPQIVFVGRLVHEHKGVLNLPAVVARFAAKHDDDFHLDVIGEGPDLAALRREIARLGVGKMVNLVGDLSHDEVLTRLPSYDVLLMPSRYEGLPLVILEAMAAGVVPVVTDLPGVADELIRHRSNGFLVPRDDVEGFADALERAAQPSVRAALSRAAWETIRDRFSSQRILPRHEEVLVEAVKQRRSAMTPRSGISDYDLLGRGTRGPRVFIDAVKRGRKIRRTMRPHR
jgi:glycosyltransferase involved in cell wall biosynthesis